MKTKTIAATALVAILLSVVATAAVASSGQSAVHSENQNNNRTDDHPEHPDRSAGRSAACDNLTVGETLTVPGLAGHYANASDREISGNASGSFTFKVTAKYFEGCTLSVTGTLKLNTTTYTISGGTIVLNHGGRSGEGSGTASGGSFLISIAGLHGNSSSANVGAVRLDLAAGSSQFLVQLHSPSVGDDEGESD